jgi:hypothetical protein
MLIQSCLKASEMLDLMVIMVVIRSSLLYCHVVRRKPKLSLLPDSAGVLPGLMSDHEYGGDNCLRNVGLSQNYKMLHLRRP